MGRGGDDVIPTEQPNSQAGRRLSHAMYWDIPRTVLIWNTGHNLTGIASQFAMHLGFTCDVISVTHRSD